MSFKVDANVSQLGEVCVGLWEGNCAKVLLGISIFKQKGIN